MASSISCVSSASCACSRWSGLKSLTELQEPMCMYLRGEISETFLRGFPIGDDTNPVLGQLLILNSKTLITGEWQAGKKTSKCSKRAYAQVFLPRIKSRLLEFLGRRQKYILREHFPDGTYVDYGKQHFPNFQSTGAIPVTERWRFSSGWSATEWIPASCSCCFESSVLGDLPETSPLLALRLKQDMRFVTFIQVEPGKNDLFDDLVRFVLLDADCDASSSSGASSVTKIPGTFRSGPSDTLPEELKKRKLSLRAEKPGCSQVISLFMTHQLLFTFHVSQMKLYWKADC